MSRGRSNVAALNGGWAAWQESGYPIEGTAVVAPVEDSLLDVAVLGSPDAPVTIVEFSDYQCSYCQQHALETLPQIAEMYIDSGQVRYVFRDFPLPSHACAQSAAEAARCAGAQGAYWEMHDRLFAEQAEWAAQEADEARASFATYASELGLETAAFEECLASGVYGEQVRQAQLEANEAGVEGAPSFFVNDQFAAGAYPFERFQQMIEAALAEAED
jgi:protein-disulfide isomerase